jgi:HPt (histidine-containing phosphotransfer) domain-containing protein
MLAFADVLLDGTWVQLLNASVAAIVQSIEVDDFNIEKNRRSKVIRNAHKIKSLSPYFGGR